MKKRRVQHNLKVMDDRTAVFAFLVFLVVVLFLFDSAADQQALFGSRTTQTTAQSGASVALTKELADQIVSKLTIDSHEDDGIAFIVKDTVDPQLLEYFTKLDYETIKARLNIQSDFVIHLEDQEGMLIPMGDRFCIGSKSAKLNGVPCG